PRPAGTDPRQPARPHRRSRIPPLVATPRVSRSASPARTPNSSKWTRSTPAAPQPSNSASPASPTPPDVPLSLQTSETSSDTTEHEVNIKDHFSSKKIGP